MNTPPMLTRTPHVAHLGRDPPHTLGRGTLLTCGDVEENPGPKGGKPGQARRARRRGNSPPEPAAPQDDGTNEEEVDEGDDLLNDPTGWSHQLVGNHPDSGPRVGTDSDIISGLLVAGMPLGDMLAMSATPLEVPRPACASFETVAQGPHAPSPPHRGYSHRLHHRTVYWSSCSFARQGWTLMELFD